MILMNIFVGQQWKCRTREQTYEHGMGEGKGVMSGENSMETYTLHV